MGFGSERHAISLREWRIWPVLTACAGTQLAYGVLHMVIKDFFACILTLFSFIGTLCCVVSRRSEVVLANLLLQLVIFTTLLICCCLGTSSMQVWHENKQLVPLVVTQILFFAVVLILNAILLILKKRQQQCDIVSEECAFAHSKLPFGRTESSATAYTASPTSPHALAPLQHRGEERKAQSEQGLKHETYTCCVPVCVDADKSCRGGVNLLSANVIRGLTRQNPSSLHNRELSRINQQSRSFLCENENGDETNPALSLYRASRASAGDKFTTTSHLVIRSQQIEAAASSPPPSAPYRSATLQTLGSKNGRNSRYFATPLIQQQSCALHGRAFSSVSMGGNRTLDGGRRTPRVVGAPALPRSTLAEDTSTEAAAGTAGSPCVCLVDCEHQQNASTMAVTPYTATSPRRPKFPCHNNTIPCPCSPQTSGDIALSCIPSLRTCTSLPDGGNAWGTASLEQNDSSFWPVSTDKHRRSFGVSITKTVGRWWEMTLSYLGQPINCDSVLAAPDECPEKLQQTTSVTQVTPSRSTTGKTIQGRTRKEPPEEFLSSSCTFYQCRRTSEEDSKVSADGICAAPVMGADMKEVSKDSADEGEGDELQEKEALPQQQDPLGRECVGGSTFSDTCGHSSPALPPASTFPPYKLSHCPSDRDSFVSSAACMKESSTVTAKEGLEQKSGTPNVGVLSVTEMRTEIRRFPLEQNRSQRRRSGSPAIRAKPADPSSAPGVDDEEMAVSGEDTGGQACFPIQPSPATARGDHRGHCEQTHLNAMDMWEGGDRTGGNQRRRSPIEVGNDEEDLNCILRPAPSGSGTLFDSKLMLRSGDVEVSAELGEIALVEDSDINSTTHRLEAGENCFSRDEAASTHRVLSTPSIKDASITSQEASWSTRYAVPPVETFNRLPADNITDAEESTLQDGSAGDAQLSNVRMHLGEQGLAAETGTNIGDQFPTTVETAAFTVPVEPLPTVGLGGEPVGTEPLLSAQGDPHSFAGQPSSEDSQCIIAARGYTAQGEESVESENYIYSRTSEEDPHETSAPRVATVNLLSSERRHLVETGTTTDVSGEQRDPAENGTADANDAGAHVRSGVVQAQCACNGDGLKETEHNVERSGVKSSAAAPRIASEMPVSCILGKTSMTKEFSCGGGVSREKVVYRDHLTRGPSSNTTPKTEEDDSWEDESEGTEEQSQIHGLTRKEKDGGSEWELSDISDAGTRLEKRRQGRGTNTSQRNRPPSGEGPAVYSKRAVRKNRECRK